MKGEMTDTGGYKMESNNDLSLQEVYDKWIDEFDGFEFKSDMELTMGLSYQIVRLGIAYAELLSAIDRHLKSRDTHAAQ